MHLLLQRLHWVSDTTCITICSSAKLKTAFDNQTLLKAVTGLQQQQYYILPIHLKKGRATSLAGATKPSVRPSWAPHDQSISAAAHPQKLQKGEGEWQSGGGWEGLTWNFAWLPCVPTVFLKFSSWLYAWAKHKDVSWVHRNKVAVALFLFGGLKWQWNIFNLAESSILWIILVYDCSCPSISLWKCFKGTENWTSAALVLPNLKWDRWEKTLTTDIISHFDLQVLLSGHLNRAFVVW